MSKSLVLIGFAVGLTLFLLSCGGDDVDELPTVDIPLAFLSPMAAGDYTVRITITAADIANQIINEQNLAIVEGRNQTYEVTVNDVPVGDRRAVNVEVFKAGNRLYAGSGAVNISSGGNQLALRLEKVAELLSSEPRTGAQMLSSGLLTLNFSAPPGIVTVNGRQAVVQGRTATWTAFGLTTGAAILNIAWTAAGGGSDTLQLIIIGSPAIDSIIPSTATLTAIGMTVQLSATVKDGKDQSVPGATVNWSSSNPSVVSVSPQGLATARGNGTVTIRATSGAKSLTAVITVAQLATTIEITPAIPPLIALGQTLQLGATVRDPNNNLIVEAEVNWASSNPHVAAISPTGLVTARGNGQTTIIASAGGLSHTVTITVPDTMGPSIVSGTVSDGAVKIDVSQINAIGFRFEFNEPIIGNIKLTDEAGENLNWIANVLGQTATLTMVPGKELVDARTYKIEIDVKDGADNKTTQTITFVTAINK